MATKTSLTVIICTFNRAQQLAELLNTLKSTNGDRQDLEVVVVDNNCTDETAAIISNHAWSAVRYVREAQQGLSHARNRGIAAARHEYLLFLDDDALAPEGFLSSLAELLGTAQPDLFGGPILPLFETEPPPWFPPEIETRRYAKTAGFSGTATLSGGNFGVRKDVIVHTGGFDTTLGMRGAAMAFGEDREFVERYRRLTPPPLQKLYYDPALFVWHRVGGEKLTKGYQLRRSFETSRARERVFIGAGFRSKTQSRVYAIGRLALAPLSLAATLMRHGLSMRGRFLAEYQAWGMAGRFAGAFSSAQQPPDEYS